MSKKSKKDNAKENKMTKEQIREEMTRPWISMRTGLVLMAITSVLMAVLTAYQSYPNVGLARSILWGLFYGGLIWAIFFGNLLINRFLRRKR